MTIVHQGNVYEPSIYAITFLVELLGSTQTKDKENILDLLIDIAYAIDYRKNKSSFLYFEHPKMKEYERELFRQRKWSEKIKYKILESFTHFLSARSKNVYIEVEMNKHIDFFLKFLSDEDDTFFDLGIKLLSYFPDKEGQVASCIIDLLKSVSNCIRKAKLLFLLRFLHGEKYLETFQKIYSKGGSKLMKLCSAVCIGFSQKEIPKNVANFLFDNAMENDQELIQNCTKNLFHYWHTIIQILVFSDKPVKETVFPIFLKELQGSKHWSYVEMKLLLMIAFFCDKPITVKNPNEFQKQILTEIMKRNPPEQLLEDFALPSTISHDH